MFSFVTFGCDRPHLLSCIIMQACLFVWLVGFLMSSSTTRLCRGRAPRQSISQFYVLPHLRQSWETMTSVSAGHIILTPTQPVGSGWPQRESNPGPPHQELRTLPTELPRPLLCKQVAQKYIMCINHYIIFKNLNCSASTTNCEIHIND